MKKQYLSTTKLCEIYDVTKEFFLRKKNNGTFLQNTHYIQRSHFLRWDIQEIENWFRGDSEPSKDIDDILNKIIPN